MKDYQNRREHATELYTERDPSVNTELVDWSAKVPRDHPLFPDNEVVSENNSPEGCVP
jgi:hypothetical protein